MANIIDALPISKKDLMSIINNLIPSGAIMWFDLDEPPEGWEVYTPLLGKYPLGANTGIGSEVTAGLPNITGHAPLHTNANVHSDYDYTGSALYRTNKSKGYYEASEGRTGDITYFDASRSNSIYGNSTTVTPPSVKLLPCRKL